MVQFDSIIEGTRLCDQVLATGKQYIHKIDNLFRRNRNVID